MGRTLGHPPLRLRSRPRRPHPLMVPSLSLHRMYSSVQSPIAPPPSSRRQRHLRPLAVPTASSLASAISLSSRTAQDRLSSQAFELSSIGCEECHDDCYSCSTEYRLVHLSVGILFSCQLDFCIVSGCKRDQRPCSASPIWRKGETCCQATVRGSLHSTTSDGRDFHGDDFHLPEGVQRELGFTFSFPVKYHGEHEHSSSGQRAFPSMYIWKRPSPTKQSSDNFIPSATCPLSCCQHDTFRPIECYRSAMEKAVAKQGGDHDSSLVLQQGTKDMMPLPEIVHCN